MNNIELEYPKIVPKTNGLLPHKAHLEREKEITRLHDQVSAERRELPWVEIEKNYVFVTPNGKETLADLFDGRESIDRLPFHARSVGPVRGTQRIWVANPRK